MTRIYIIKLLLSPNSNLSAVLLHNDRTIGTTKGYCHPLGKPHLVSVIASLLGCVTIVMKWEKCVSTESEYLAKVERRWRIYFQEKRDTHLIILYNHSLHCDFTVHRGILAASEWLQRLLFISDKLLGCAAVHDQYHPDLDHAVAGDLDQRFNAKSRGIPPSHSHLGQDVRLA